MTIASKLTTHTPFGEFHFELAQMKIQAALLGHTFSWCEDYQGKEKWSRSSIPLNPSTTSSTTTT